MPRANPSFPRPARPRPHLSADTRAADYRLPPMAEEIAFAPDGRLLTMCESASHKYWFGLLTGAQWCYATDLTRMAGHGE